MKRIILLCSLASTLSVSAQNMIQMQQLPLLISPSFAGSDTSARVVLAMQKYGWQSEGIRETHDRNKEGYLASFDLRNASQTKAFGGYLHYAEVEQTSNESRLRDPYHESHTHFVTDKIEAGVSYVPVFWKVSLVDKKKNWNLIPALSLSYSHHTTQWDRYNYEGYDQTLIEPSFPVKKRDSISRSKDFSFERVSLGGSLMLQGSRLFVSGQLGVQYDQVAMKAASNKSQIDYYNVYSSSSSFENYSKGYLRFAHHVAFGAYFPKRSNSLIQFNPIIMTSLILTRSTSNDSHGRTEPSYDYGDSYESVTSRVSLNVRVWKFLGGYNSGGDSYTGPMSHYYIGYKAPKMTVTAGIVNSDIYNASLQYNFR